MKPELICLMLAALLVAVLSGCATVPEPKIVMQTVKVPFAVNCTAGLPALRTVWPLDAVKPTETDLRVIVKTMAEDDAAWRDYAKSLEAATAGCRP
jgi:hypothetical protein